MLRKRELSSESSDSQDDPDDSDDSQSDIEVDETQSSSEDEEEELSKSRPIPQKSATPKQALNEKGKSESMQIGDEVIQWKVVENETTAVLREHRTANGIYKNEDLFRFRNDMGLSIWQYFLMIFPLSFWKEVVTNTNQYAALLKAKHWTPLDLSELWNFLAIILIFSVRTTPRIRDLWREDSLFVCPLVRGCGLTYWRWSQIRKYLHIAPVMQPAKAKDDKYWKVRKMITVVIENSKLKVPHARHYSLDEMTIGYQGRTYLIKRTPSKKVPKGFQCLALSTDGGYVIDIHFDSDSYNIAYPDLSATGNRVLKLASNLKTLGKYSILYMDNRFSTPLLFGHLLRDYFVYATGTWRINYGVPNLIKIVAKGVEEVKAAKNAGAHLCYTTIDDVKVFGMSLYDNAPFYMLTTGEYKFEPIIGGTKSVERYSS
jgi:hypothetical protein